MKQTNRPPIVCIVFKNLIKSASHPAGTIPQAVRAAALDI